MILPRRILMLIVFAFWQGGFTFYTSVVVPVGTDILGGPAEQGRITREVTRWLNVAGLVALPVLAWDAAATRPGRRARLACVAGMAAALVVLYVLYPRLDALFDHDLARVRDRREFRRLHKTYLWVSTAQWAAGLIYLIASPAAWRAADQSAR
jgi:hypothetical protein